MITVDKIKEVRELLYDMRGMNHSKFIVALHNLKDRLPLLETSKEVSPSVMLWFHYDFFVSPYSGNLLYNVAFRYYIRYYILASMVYLDDIEASEYFWTNKITASGITRYVMKLLIVYNGRIFTDGLVNRSEDLKILEDLFVFLASIRNIELPSLFTDVIENKHNKHLLDMITILPTNDSLTVMTHDDFKLSVVAYVYNNGTNLEDRNAIEQFFETIQRFHLEMVLDEDLYRWLEKFKKRFIKRKPCLSYLYGLIDTSTNPLNSSKRF